MGGVDPRRPGCNGCGLTLFSPNLNLVRDPRWGRAQETFGEDPTLTARLLVPFVRGAQHATHAGHGSPAATHASHGSTAEPASAARGSRKTAALTVGMCCKHFAIYDVEDRPKPRYTFNATVNARDLWESYLPAFEACVVEAQATHVMCSYNQINGTPACR